MLWVYLLQWLYSTLTAIYFFADKSATKRPLQELSVKAKAKRAKYDPDQMKTVTRVQELLLQHEEEVKESKLWVYANEMLVQLQGLFCMFRFTLWLLSDVLEMWLWFSSEITLTWMPQDLTDD